MEDVLTLEIPLFELYKTKLSHSHNNKEKVAMDVIGIKSMLPQARLLKELYSQLVSPAHFEKQLKVFVPTRAVHMHSCRLVLLVNVW